MGNHKVSILQGKKKECYITGATEGLEQHHIYMGKNRTISDDNGFWVWLHYKIHKDLHSKDGHNLDMKLKRECQEAYEKKHTRKEFMQLIGRNYLE